MTSHDTTRSISVVIRAYTLARWDLLVRAIESLYAQTLPPEQIVLVSDGNAELAQRARAHFAAVTLVEHAQTEGSSRAWNSGVSAACGAIIAFIDDDARAAPDWLERLAAPYADPHIVGVGGTIVPEWADGRPAWFPEEFDWVVGCTYRGLPTQPAPVRNLIGCNMSFRRAAFEQNGGFRQGMGHARGNPIGCDETEWCIRLGALLPDAVLLHQPDAVVYHHVPAQRGTWGYFWRRCAFEGRSKALVTRFGGARRGLSAESAYTLRVLPLGVARGLGAALRGEPGGLGRAAAIMGGFGVTAGSYALGRLEQLVSPLDLSQYEVRAITACPPAAVTASDAVR